MGAAAARRATQDDCQAIDDLVHKARRVVLHMPWDRVLGGESNRGALATHDFFLVEQDGQIGCACGLHIRPGTVAQMRILALYDGWPVYETLRSLLPLVMEALGEKKIRRLAFIGSEAWLLPGLMGNDFRPTQTILTFQKTNFAIPDPGHPSVIVRPATPGDFAAILSIDRAAFEPLWHNTWQTLAECLGAPFFDVAELDGCVVGYAHATLTGRHAHLARIAVHTAWQGQHIGTRLLAEAIRFFQHQRVFGITLNTQHDNARARRLYEWFGFELLGEEAQVWIRDQQERRPWVYG